jgi:hypothetical protein
MGRLALRAKPNRSRLQACRRHQPPDRVEDYLEVAVVSLLERFQLPSELRIGCEHPAQSHEGPDDLYVDAYSALALENPGQHCYSLLSERVGSITTASPPFSKTRRRWF